MAAWSPWRRDKLMSLIYTLEADAHKRGLDNQGLACKRRERLISQILDIIFYVPTKGQH